MQTFKIPVPVSLPVFFIQGIPGNEDRYPLPSQICCLLQIGFTDTGRVILTDLKKNSVDKIICSNDGWCRLRKWIGSTNTRTYFDSYFCIPGDCGHIKLNFNLVTRSHGRSRDAGSIFLMQ